MELKNVTEARPKRLLHLKASTTAAFFAGLDWRFYQGEQWVVSGPNGSGKSLLAALLAGRAFLPGVRLTLAPALEERVALVSFDQQREQVETGWLQARWHWLEEVDHPIVAQFLAYDSVQEINPFEIRPDDSAARQRFARRLEQIRKLLDLAPLSNHWMLHLSHGEMRRVLLARALLENPRLLVLDDPFAGLDSRMRLQLIAILAQLVRDGLPLVLMIRHADEIPPGFTHHLQLGDACLIGKLRPSGLGAAQSPPLPSAETYMTLPPAPAVPQTGPAALPLVELCDVSISYGSRIIFNKLNWTVRTGERWVVSGPNGSGKTTLLSLISGDNPAAYANDIRVFGRPRKVGESLWAIRRRIGQVSPEMQCYFNDAATCLEAVLSGRLNRDGLPVRPTRVLREEALRWLALFGLSAESAAPFGSLSAGHQRLVLLARAFFPQPPLLLLDEPCFSLDQTSRRLVLETLERILSERRQETVIYVAHRTDDIPQGFNHELRLTLRPA